MVDPSEIIDVEQLLAGLAAYGRCPPFDHCVIDGFFHDDVARRLADEFPDYDSGEWLGYDSPLEVKKACNSWNAFPPLTYRVFSTLNSKPFIDLLSAHLTVGRALYADPGLNGGGWHIHRASGHLNTHLDYSLHPKLGLQRKLNIIVYLTPAWQEDWGGALGLWGAESAERPGELVTSVWCRFNRAVIFDTTQNSWHGLPEPIRCPATQYRKSIAAYFLCDPTADADARGKALFAPSSGQEADASVLDLIARRADVRTAAGAYTNRAPPPSRKD